MSASSTTGPDLQLAAARLLKVRQVAELLGVHPRTIWRLSSTGEGGFPGPVSIGPKTKRWRLADIERFIRDRGAAS